MRPVASAAPNVRIWDGTDLVEIIDPTQLQVAPGATYFPVLATLALQSGGNVAPMTNTVQGDGMASTNVLLSNGAFVAAFNGATWDRYRNNTEGTLLASATRSASTGSADQTNYNAKGVLISFDITARTVGASPLITVVIQWKDPISGDYLSLMNTANFNPTTINRDFIVYPGVTDDDANLSGLSGLALPRTWRCFVTFIADVTDLTFSISFAYIL